MWTSHGNKLMKSWFLLESSSARLWLETCKSNDLCRVIVSDWVFKVSTRYICVVALSMPYIIKSYRCHFLLTDISNAELEKELFSWNSHLRSPKKSTTVITSFDWCLHREKSCIVCKQTSRKVSVAMMEQDSCLDIECYAFYIPSWRHVLILLLSTLILCTCLIFVFLKDHTIFNLCQSCNLIAVFFDQKTKFCTKLEHPLANENH